MLSDRRPPSPRSSTSACYSILIGVIYLFVALLFLRIGRGDENVADAAFEAEDPEGLVNEGMPPSLDHVDPTS